MRILLDPAGTEGNGNNADEVARLKAENADLKKRVPADGSLVLNADQRRAWDGYQALGGVDDVRANLEAGRKAQGEVASYHRGEHLEKVAKAAGLNPTVFKRLIGDHDTRVEEIDGKPQAQVKDKGEWKPLDDAYAKANWPDFLPSLKPSKPLGQGGTPPRTGLTHANHEAEAPYVDFGL